MCKMQASFVQRLFLLLVFTFTKRLEIYTSSIHTHTHAHTHAHTHTFRPKLIQLILVAIGARTQGSIADWLSSF